MLRTDQSIVNPLVSAAGTIDGHISSRLMAAYRLDAEHVIHVHRDRVDSDGRIYWAYVLERNGRPIFKGADFSTPHDVSYGEAARGVLGFLTLGEHDTDAEYFETYTPRQLTWRDECAEDLALYAMDEDD